MAEWGYLGEELDGLRQKGLLRQIPWIEGPVGPRVRMGGREVILLCSNDYLGISQSPALAKAAKEAMEKWGCGAPASRSIAGSLGIHRELEEELAQLKGTSSALLFSTGYMANIGLLTTLLREGDLILSDELNHASIVDGCRLSRAEVWIYRHRDMDHLAELLRRSNHRRRLIVTDGVFSMEGDIAPLREIKELAGQYDAFVMLDDAHATGVLGREGRGTAEHFGLLGQIEVQMGTLGKALGVMGAFVAGERVLIDYLINRCRPFMYTTSPPPPLVAMSKAALKVMREEGWRRERLWENTRRLREGLRELGFRVRGETPIVPVLIGDNRLVMEASRRLLELGVFVQGIRPPTVPEGASRLRVSVSASHGDQEIEEALEAFRQVGEELRLI
ncbi:MAG: 8-amino-7-oxononanoate synthase [Deltaproteobacteria bacterium]|nr:MAG: 8-amino-7-oxononanoate synthase [Deltaproteobacteria bacterium]